MILLGLGAILGTPFVARSQTKVGKYVTPLMTVHADLGSAADAPTCASAAGDQMDLNPAGSAMLSLNPPVQVVRALHRPYWASNLFKVMDHHTACSILHDLDNGVRIGCSPPPPYVVASPNWPSVYQFREKVSDVIAEDLAAGRLYDPFSLSPFPVYTVSPLGAFLKRKSTKIRLIHDLSFFH